MLRGGIWIRGWEVDAAWASGVSGLRLWTSRSMVSLMREKVSLSKSGFMRAVFAFIGGDSFGIRSIPSSKNSLYLLVSATVLLNNCGPE